MRVHRLHLTRVFWAAARESPLSRLAGIRRAASPPCQFRWGRGRSTPRASREIHFWPTVLASSDWPKSTVPLVPRSTFPGCSSLQARRTFEPGNLPPPGLRPGPTPIFAIFYECLTHPLGRPFSDGVRTPGHAACPFAPGPDSTPLRGGLYRPSGALVCEPRARQAILARFAASLPLPPSTRPPHRRICQQGRCGGLRNTSH